MKLGKIIFPLVTIPCLAVLVGCTSHPQLTVRNQSASPLSNLVVSGAGFSRNLGALAPGEQKRTRVNPSGESGLQVDFDAGGKHVSAKPDCYFENSPHYRVTATVAADFSVKVDVALWP
jgi:hypothetical protein